MSGCPNTTASGCRCPEHDPGLSEHAADPAVYDLALQRSRPARLLVVTMPPAEICHGYAHGCRCDGCLVRAEHGGNIPPAREPSLQPWDPRPARQRRAA